MEIIKGLFAILNEVKEVSHIRIWVPQPTAINKFHNTVIYIKTG